MKHAAINFELLVSFLATIMVDNFSLFAPMYFNSLIYIYSFIFSASTEASAPVVLSFFYSGGSKINYNYYAWYDYSQIGS